ncbi:FAD-binding oxidoreductase [Flavobacterium sp. ZB4P13]|uniref:FAD-binding oxidoreductase n=1 Tax=Flavobacterium sp. ZB4P13 TaxID=3401728 RepID=UPI003AAD94BB
MNYSNKIIQDIISIVGEKYLITQLDKMYNYSFDITSNECIHPLGVILPKNTEEVSEILKYCYKNDIKITIRGGGSSVSGGSIPRGNDFVLSMERLNNIIEINKINRTVTLESGVITETLKEEVSKHGLCFPQNMSSASQSFIGGNIAISSGSPKSLKYGNIKNSVLNLEVVLADGQILWTGKNVSKNATGYNLTQLFIGSEGTLGIITKAVLKLEIPKKEVLFLIPFKSLQRLFEFTNEFFYQGFSASCIEFLDKKGYELVSDFLNNKKEFGDNIEGLLWIEYEIDSDNQIGIIADFISDYIDEEDVLFADTKNEMDKLWAYRKKIGLACINYSTFKDIDIVVPRSSSSEIYNEIVIACSKYNFEYIVVGHIGDGNYHINIFNNTSNGLEWEKNIELCFNQIFNKVNQLGGTLSGEHGVGSLYNSYLNIVMPQNQIDLMKNIKSIFDKKQILNSNLIF